MMKKNRLLITVCGLALLVLPQFVHAQTAQTPIIDLNGWGMSGPTSFAVTYGFQFTVISGSIPLTGLGLFDVLSKQLTESHAVGLWDSNGTLLSSTTIDNSATPVPSSSPAGRWLEKDITAITLSAGTYVLGAFFTGGTNPDAIFFRMPSVTPIPGVSYVTTMYTFGSSLLLPTISLPNDNPGIFGPMAFTGCQITAYTIPGLLLPLKQPDDHKCWAYTATTLVSWKMNTPLTAQQVVVLADNAPPKPVTIFAAQLKTDDGLPVSFSGPFLARLGMVTTLPNQPTVCQLSALLHTPTPAWVVTGDYTYDENGKTIQTAHAEVLVGIYGDGSDTGTFLQLIDPATGTMCGPSPGNGSPCPNYQTVMVQIASLSGWPQFAHF